MFSLTRKVCPIISRMQQVFSPNGFSSFGLLNFQKPSQTTNIFGNGVRFVTYGREYQPSNIVVNIYHINTDHYYLYSDQGFQNF
ncbi:unnamed protein product [Rhizophagus irregularis]|uniref:Uncharacterized protein n=1 Tax=Rhizophagus irregularis TaxID=588596 RepID=A0A916EIM6_9GLOM|nr:hypothetical protein OCT59_006158 [Rhizophagus irregularis]GBC38469.1 hypothetical protein RIR_jg4818.t1 [Rhizophagus irregularis DAOM 181602=DAOM 197198]CAB4377290.1 unnamed protein product [Rhizophagus irregularis]CAB4410170.1 unnamed protein product [Rhizophagus irregularis]CAB5101327.1 unnamed protein product [Rhizophagus irregularis]